VQRVQPLLSKDLETNKKTTALAMQEIGKHDSTTIVIVGNGVFYVSAAEEL
jgi:hypothetical protein